MITDRVYERGSLSWLRTDKPQNAEHTRLEDWGGKIMRVTYKVTREGRILTSDTRGPAWSYRYYWVTWNVEEV